MASRQGHAFLHMSGQRMRVFCWATCVHFSATSRREHSLWAMLETTWMMKTSQVELRSGILLWLWVTKNG